MDNNEDLKTDRVTVRRFPKRGVYDLATVGAILDEGLVCHVGFVLDGQPFVIPTAFARKRDVVYIHGSAASRMLRTVREAIPVCITVTLLDGLVLARSAFNHSMNYRSVVIVGTASEVVGDEKLEALELISEHIIPGRWNEIRYPTETELKATLVLKVPITEASAKIRTGPPVDDEEDYALTCWAGVIPLRFVALPPVPDARLAAGILPSAGVRAYSRPTFTPTGS
jgi:nitroimidazol reductase NimA-like FMN-containing flavoprotein (pyridoxamine 5'-phosphate oxidase superfamily)